MTIANLFTYLFTAYASSFVLGFLINRIKGYFDDLLN